MEGQELNAALATPASPKQSPAIETTAYHEFNAFFFFFFFFFLFNVPLFGAGGAMSGTSI